ncbi:MAG: tRNA-dihydrouridine synthase family protein [bacterium]|nr:tRNA-dihydrouridine synthase family protein [bacterium]
MNIYPDNALILAPLAGYTDLPYRHSCRRHGCLYAFTEMVDTGSLIYAKRNLRQFLDKGDDEKWLGVQIVGAELDQIDKAIDIINQGNYSVLDLNIGCPTPKVAKKGKGSGLAKDPDKAAKIIDLMVKKSKFPVTAKIRIQNEEDPKSTIYLAKKLENAGANAITIHGRVAKKIYSGECYSNIISEVQKNLNIQVIANGGAFDLKTYKELRDNSGCSPVMIARGAMGNPWIFELLTGKRKELPTTEELCHEMKMHIAETIGYYGEVMAMKLARKFILDYLSGRGYTGKLKCEVVKLKTAVDFKEFMIEVKKGPTERYQKWVKKFGP